MQLELEGLRRITYAMAFDHPVLFRKTVKWKRSALIVASVLLAFGAIWFASREPSIRGRPISFWISCLRDEDQTRKAEAINALRSMDEATVTFLAKQISAPDSVLRRIMTKRHLSMGTPPVELMPTTNLRRAMAAAALSIGGEQAKAAIPTLTKATNNQSMIVSSYATAALIRLRNDSSDYFVDRLTNGSQSLDALKAACVLYALGTNAEWLGLQLKTNLLQTASSNHFEILEFLCVNEMDPPLAWPIITYALESNWPFKANAVNSAIGQIRFNLSSPKWAEQAKPAIIGCLKIPDPNLRKNAIFALSVCYRQDANLLPAPVLNGLVHDPDPGIRAWALELQKRVKTP